MSKSIRCDLGRTNPLGMRAYYPLITSFLCVDSISTSKKIWHTCMRNLFDVAAPEGTLILTSLGDSGSYHVGAKCFPSANLDRDELYHSLLSLGFKKESIFVSIAPLEEEEHTS
ncbi:MAG: hypothetical protein AMJ79_11510 [Phycisphaerae bacterium SM23_30]|nr:MAG: hypothetical protein AMJ79_11510 [Phycisphaerae bacterium SM23_30]